MKYDFWQRRFFSSFRAKGKKPRCSFSASQANKFHETRLTTLLLSTIRPRLFFLIKNIICSRRKVKTQTWVGTGGEEPEKQTLTQRKFPHFFLFSFFPRCSLTWSGYWGENGETCLTMGHLEKKRRAEEEEEEGQSSLSANKQGFPLETRIIQ